MNIIDEASYGRIYQHTRDNGTFAIIGSEDKDTHKNRYNELKQLIKKYERRYGHLGYNKLSGTYQYRLTGETTKEPSIIVYGISKKDALSIAKRINQESIIWKENTFFGIIDVKGNILDRFKKSTLNFSKAIKQGIGSRLQSDQTRTFGYAFEGRRMIMNKKNLSESIMYNLKKLNESDSIDDAIKELDNEDYDVYEILEDYDIDDYELLDRLHNLVEKNPNKNKEATKFVRGFFQSDDQEEYLENNDNYSGADFIYWIKDLEGK